MSTPPEVIRPADRVALLTALKDAVEKELDLARTETLDVGQKVGVKTFTTEFGPVTIASKDATPYVADKQAFIDWVRKVRPGEIVEVPTVRVSFINAVLSTVEQDPETGLFIHPGTGEVVDGLAMSAPGDPYVTWPAGRDQAKTKREAREWFHNRAPQLLSGIGQIEAPK